MRYHKRAKKRIALMLFVVLATQLIAPNMAMALTSGPSQPEMQSFEPVGTTDMVDMFSGDFVYNIPLLDVEGYPVNISYHGGVTMEQEASWVGLGWNINPGEINRMVRGIPDDFNGDTLKKELNIKDEKNLRVGLGVGGEIVGLGDPIAGVSLAADLDVNISNYKGVSCDFTFSSGINLFGCVSAGVNVGVGSQTGATIDYNKGLYLATSNILGKDISGGVGISQSSGYNTRTGIKAQNFSFSLSASSGGVGSSSSVNISTPPISIKNYVPVITNSSTMNAIYGRIKLGAEALWLYPYGTINGMFSKLHYNNDGSRESFGYLYLQNAYQDNNAILDFTRDKDGLFNRSMQYLPPASLTYDIYSVSGQGTGGIFRPFRNDFGSVFDPATYSTESTNSIGLEAGIGNLFELGFDLTTSGTEITSGPWVKYQRDFTYQDDTSGSIYENVYFKQAGELTSVDPAYFSAIGGTAAIKPDDAIGLPDVKPGSRTTRDPRGNLITYLKGGESGYATQGAAYTYDDNDFSANPHKTPVSAGGSSRIGAIIQTQENGKRYVFGLAAMNNVEKEATFSVNPPSSSDLGAGLVSYTPGTDDAITNSNGVDNYYSSTVTPGYAHSFLLTSVLSTDYVDITGDGPTDDDLGSYTKLKYSRKERDYRWKAPLITDKAQYNPGFWSDRRDDKGSYVTGSREQWMLHSIESKNFIAEFYTSQRNDGCGSTDPIFGADSAYSSSTTAASSYKLDSIKLYNKHDRFINGSSAVPIKTVFFVYSYSLCPGIPNTLIPGDGKLTLRQIYFRYGNSDRSMMSPYQFIYHGHNPGYDLSNKDRWGNYKPNAPGFTNYEFPYVDQNGSSHSDAWSLSRIILPSGGKIDMRYESDDYAFVQDKHAQEMFMINGLGSGPVYNSGDQLYHDKNSPYLYAYFTRRISSEDRRFSFKKNYFNDQTCLYYNFNVKLTGTNSSYEQIKGYASIEKIDTCSDGIHGYIKMKAVTPTGGGANLNPVTYSALNVGRYNLPQIIFPGSDPDESDLQNILAGLKGAFEELVSITKSPIIHLVKKNQARNVNLNKSYIRLESVGSHKRGGNQRVAQLGFYDSWNEMEGNDQSATYGKEYDYTIDDPVYGKISSGVASYEPLIGGDENPFRTPVDYTVSLGSSWPPNDPVDLYQENPIGESLFPPASVGYRRVTVTSIHKDVGRSSQGIDVYQFYTAKDFPIQVHTTTIDPPSTSHFDLFSQTNFLDATQGYSLVFNDMHGKPKSIEHLIYHPLTNTTQSVSSQVYNYNQSGGILNNNVNCLVSSGSGMRVQSKQLGIEADVTLDNRQKNETTRNFTVNSNLNVSSIGPVIIPIPLVFPWSGNYQNRFRSATVTKVIQQYGILSNVVSNNEGAITTVKNELFDPNTGNVVVTSVNNEFHDKEYSVNVPAYWAYLGMAPAFGNTNYKFTADTIFVDSNYLGRIRNIAHLHVGDELILSGSVYRDAPPVQTVAWVMGSGDETNTRSVADTVITIDTTYVNFVPHYTYNTVISSHTDTIHVCDAYVLPRYPATTLGWGNGDAIPKVKITVLRSGALNMLNETIEAYTTMDNPAPRGTLPYSLNNLINIKTKTFCDSNTRFLHKYITSPDSINPYTIGERGVYRLLSEYAYVSDRDYNIPTARIASTARTAGLFSANSFFINASDPKCLRFPYNYLMPNTTPDVGWKRARTITKWSPDGKEVENVDAIGNYSTAIYGYNEELPIAVASNARQGDVLAEGFEDYSLLNYISNLMGFNYSPIRGFFTTTSSPSPLYNIVDLTGVGSAEISSTISHTGLYSLHITSGSTVPIPLTINNNNYSGVVNHYNFYYLPGYTFTSANEYLPFEVAPGKKYILSCWVNDNSFPSITTNYSLASDCGVKINGLTYPLVKKTNLIDGWQQFETIFNVNMGDTSAFLRAPAGFFIDDVRIFPYDANMKAFVYNPFNEKLMATLDENNFATMYEYDQEGNLVRTKKETEKGIMTISESRSQNQGQQ